MIDAGVCVSVLDRRSLLDTCDVGVYYCLGSFELRGKMAEAGHAGRHGV